MFFKKKSKNRFDKFVTWIIVWWAIASMLWLSKTKKWKEIQENVKKESFIVFRKSKEIAWKTIVNILSIFNKKK